MTAIDVDVVLVDESGRALGTAARAEAHRAPGMLHAAVSVVVVNGDGEVLVQRRAGEKRLFGSCWSNSCCTHPLPGEGERAAAERRVMQELGLRARDAREVGSFVYWARDPQSTLVEFERDTVVVVRADERPDPDPAEVSAWRWVDPDALSGGRAFTPWAAYVHALGATPTMLADGGRAGGGR